MHLFVKYRAFQSSGFMIPSVNTVNSSHDRDADDAPKALRVQRSVCTNRQEVRARGAVQEPQSATQKWQDEGDDSGLSEDLGQHDALHVSASARQQGSGHWTSRCEPHWGSLLEPAGILPDEECPSADSLPVATLPPHMPSTRAHWHRLLSWPLSLSTIWSEVLQLLSRNVRHKNCLYAEQC